MTETRILSGEDVRALLDPDRCREEVEAAFRAHAAGRTLGPGVLGVPARDGGFHLKAAGLETGGRWVFAAKLNANFPGNPDRGLPTIQGVVILCDAEDGRLLALLDSAEVTALRTAAATALAARALARPDARTAVVVGCGRQAAAQVRAVARVRSLAEVHAFDTNGARAQALVAEVRGEIPGARVADDLEAAVRASAIVITCTPARRPVLEDGWVQPGTFVAAVGADHPHKRELPTALVVRSTIVVDVMESCAQMGELHHVLDEGALTRDRVHAELADLVTGTRPGRTRDDEVTVFDSTGTALEDVAAALAAYDEACRRGRGAQIRLGD